MMKFSQCNLVLVVFSGQLCSMATLSRSEALGKREVEEHVYDVNTDEDSDDSNSFSSTAFVFPHLHASSYHEHLNVSSSSNSNDPNLLVEAHQGERKRRCSTTDRDRRKRRRGDHVEVVDLTGDQRGPESPRASEARDVQILEDEEVARRLQAQFEAEGLIATRQSGPPLSELLYDDRRNPDYTPHYHRFHDGFPNYSTLHDSMLHGMQERLYRHAHHDRVFHGMQERLYRHAHHDRVFHERRGLAFGGDFTPDDYDVLLSLDSPNRYFKAAPKRVIRKLPTRKATKSEEGRDCHICLSDIVEGDVVRTLPCGHFWHKECIDKWLAVNKVCPIDKIPIC